MEDDIAQILKHNSLDLHSEEQNLGKKAVGGETKARTGGRTLEKILRTSFVNPAHWFLKGERVCACKQQPSGGCRPCVGQSRWDLEAAKSYQGSAPVCGLLLFWNGSQVKTRAHRLHFLPPLTASLRSGGVRLVGPS